MQLLCAAASLLLLLPGAHGRRNDVHPIERVIGLLQDMEAKSKAMGQEEEITWAKFSTWCKSSIRVMEETIAKEKEQVVVLEDTVSAKNKTITELKEQIVELTEELEELNATGAEADALREEQAEAAAAKEADLAATVEAIEEAIKVLTDARTEINESLLQLPSVKKALSLAASEAGTAALSAFLQKKGPFKSDKVIDLLKDLRLKFKDDLTEAQKAETYALQAHAMAAQDRKNARAAAEASKTEKEKAQGEAEEELAEAEEALGNLKDDLAADEMTLEETQSTCQVKTSEWEERSATRKQELEAIAQAIKILAKVSGVRTEPPSNPVPPPPPMAAAAESPAETPAELVQQPLSLLQVVDPKTRALNLLRAKAQQLHSKVLEKFTKDLAAHMMGPFADVNNMIQKLIHRLIAEQRDEDDHKNWCDIELMQTNKSMTEKTEKIEELTMKIEDGKATVQELAEEISAAMKMVSDIDAHVAEATAIREEGKAENAAAIKDAQDSQEAITQAMAVLEEFYKEQGEPATVLLQRKQPVELPAQPSTWDASYTGITDPRAQPDGILTVLEEVSADFAKMEADTKAQEVTDAKAYHEEMSDCDIEKKRRLKESDMKTQQKTRTEEQIKSQEKMKKENEEQLAALEKYLEELQPACVEGDSTYEVRKASREQEIEALKEAQTILANAYKDKPDGGESFLQVREVARRAS